jgi:tRNA(His) 5'-end guanylyltransferase
MKFDNLKQRMEYFKELANHKLIPNSYVIAHIDGRSFSKMVKNRFILPYDDQFIDMMNNTAAYVCQKVQGCKLAYVQSDEISLVITDIESINTDSFFDYRLCKLQSIIASLATCKFNQLYYLYKVRTSDNVSDDIEDILSDDNLFQFDCKCFNVPSYNDTFAWLKYRQNDCIRNSRSQAAQTYLPHNMLKGVKSEQQIDLLKTEKNIDWNNYSKGKKYGRLIYKETFDYTSPDGSPYQRTKWVSHEADIFTRDMYDDLGLVPDMSKIDYEHDNEEVKHNYVDSVGVVLKEPDGMFKMPFYFGILLDGSSIMFIDEGETKLKAGDNFIITKAKLRDDGTLYWGKKISLNGQTDLNKGK